MLLMAALEHLAHWSISLKGGVFFCLFVFYHQSGLGNPNSAPCTSDSFQLWVWKMPGESQGEFLLCAP